MKRALLTGATGLLGYHTAVQLLKMGYKVRLFLRNTSKTEHINKLPAEQFRGSLTSTTDIEKAVKGCSYIIHCAANTEQKGRIIKFEQANICSTRNLIEAAKIENIERMVFVSSANCFTNGTKNNPGNEQSKFMPWLKNSGYAQSKYLAQELVLNETRTGGLNAVVLAPTFIIGAYDSKPSSGRLILKGLKNKIVFYPPGGKSFVDAELVATAIVNALTKGSSGESYILSGKNITYKDFFSCRSKLINKKQLLVKIPGIFMKIIGITGSLLARLSIENVFTITNIRLLIIENYFTNQKAKSELGFKDTNLEKALKKSLDWYSENKYF